MLLLVLFRLSLIVLVANEEETSVTVLDFSYMILFRTQVPMPPLTSRLYGTAGHHLFLFALLS